MIRKQQHIRTGKSAPCLRAGLLSLLLCLLLVGCIKEEYEPEVTPARTILFYMGGDNNLSSEVNRKIEQIQAAALPPCTQVLIYKDTRGSNPQLLELVRENNEIKTTVVNEYEKSNSASAETFGAVLREVREIYPAPSFGLVVFSHASGWLPEGAYNNPNLRSTPVPSLGERADGEVGVRSIIIDGESEMEITAFAAAIPDGMFDFIAFEACFMAGIEVAWELKDKTNYIIASSAEIVSPGFAGCYAEALPHLYRGDLTAFCQTVEADYRTRSGDYGSLTLSLIKTSALDGLASVVRGRDYPSAETVQRFDRYGGSLFFDLGDCYGLRASEQEAAVFETAIDGCVVWKTATASFMPNYGGYEVLSHSGLTTYISQEQYPKLNEVYKELRWYKEVLSHE